MLHWGCPEVVSDQCYRGYPEKARTVAGIKIKAVSSKKIFTLLQRISETLMELLSKTVGALTLLTE